MSDKARCTWCSGELRCVLPEDHIRKGQNCEFEPAEPSPAPQTQREWFVADSMPEAMKILADKLKQAESALTTMRAERDQYKESFNLECDRREGCLDQLTAMHEERDRAQDAIYWADGQRGEFRERGPKEGAYWWRKELMERAGLQPVSDRQPEGETK